MADFKASPEDWECIDWSAKQGGYIPRALAELKQRVKALEDAQQPPALATSAPTSSLVERVTDVISTGRHSEARAAIRAVALWLRRRGWTGGVAQELEREADRG